MAISKAGHHGMGDSSMLERIDALFSCGVGDLINLPQIVVVGDQSSGKSSVLSGLLRRDFPRDRGLCTRFATKIVFRRATTPSVRASIIPDENAGSEHIKELLAWGDIQADSFDDLDFGELMREVHDVIGVSAPNEESSSKHTFSGDVLQLEISGPDEEHLSVIDVPGIFRDVTPGRTTKDDIKFVRKMVLGYMNNPRCVMLTVIPANVDVTTQEILQMATDLDPDGNRTLGVLTKPDLVDYGAEDIVIELVEGRSRKIKLGWHILRNPGQNDLKTQAFDREGQELEFFRNESPWNNLDPDCVGIESLRNRLKDILSGLVRREFAMVKSDIQKRLDTAESKLKALGPERNGRVAQAAYLTELSTRFQHLVDMALRANFGTDDLFDEYEELKIAPAVVARMEEFSEDMQKWGHSYSFDPLELRPAGLDTKEYSHGAPQKNFCVRKCTAGSDIESVLCVPQNLPCPSAEHSDAWLRILHKCNRGFELGTFDPVILASAMRKQTTSWKPIGFGFVSDVAQIIHAFTTKALECICVDERLRLELYHTLYDELTIRYTKAMEQVKFIFEVELDGHPMTQNHFFLDGLEESRQKRFADKFEHLAISNDSLGRVVKLEDLATKHPLSDKRYLVREIHDILQSYYNVARKRFVDTVCKQASDYYLLAGPNSPLRVFSPIFVSKMEDDELERIAKEDPQTQKQREKLVKDIERLRKARQVSH